MSKTQNKAKLKTTAIEFLGAIQDAVQLPSKVLTKLDLGVRILKSKTDDSFYEDVIKYLMPHSKEIKAKNKDYFHNSAKELFGMLGDEIFAIIMSLMNDETVTGKENKECIWVYFKTMVCIVEKENLEKKRN